MKRSVIDAVWGHSGVRLMVGDAVVVRLPGRIPGAPDEVARRRGR